MTKTKHNKIGISVIRTQDGLFFKNQLQNLNQITSSENGHPH